MKTIEILIAEDEMKMRDLVSLYLTKENFKVTAVEDGAKALGLLESHEFHLFIIDVMMPNLDGFSLAKEIRSFSNSPIIFLTARGEEYERLMGFDLGADDYIVKPFSPREMVARVKAVLRRAGSYREEESSIKVGNILLDIAGREVYIKDEKTILTPKEFDLLVYLIKNQGTVLSRDQITEYVWDYAYYGDQRTVDTHVKKLREKLGEDSGTSIKTIWGVGYKFEVN